MPNPITGDFDVVAEFSVPTVNRVLAAIHQNGQDESAPGSIHFLHSFQTHVDDSPHSVPDPIPPSERTGVRGNVEVQVSTPTISLPPVDPAQPDASRVTVRYRVMTHFVADAESPSLPEFTQGDLQAIVPVDRVDLESGNVIEVDFAASDIAVSFNLLYSEPPITDAERTRLNQLLRNFLRGEFDPTNMTLDSSADSSGLGIRYLRFKTLPSSPLPALALLLNLRDTRPSDEAPRTVTRVFLESASDYALAVSRDYLVQALRDMVTHLPPGTLPSTEFSGRWFIFSYRLSVDLNSLNLDVQDGCLNLTIDGQGTSSVGDLRFRVILAITLDLDTRGAIVVRVPGTPPADPILTVTEGGFLVRGIVSAATSVIMPSLRGARDTILAQANSFVQSALGSSNLANLLSGLAVRELNLTYTAVQIQRANDGIILQGRLSVDLTQPVVAAFTANGARFDALNSWVPGGTVQRYTWSTVSVPPVVLNESHRFITQVPSDQLNEPTRWCLQVQGTDVQDRAVSSRHCHIAQWLPGPVSLPAEVVNLRHILAVRVPHGDPAPYQIIAHIDPLLVQGATFHGKVNTLVHFADGATPDPLSTLSAAIKASGRTDSAVSVIAVFPKSEMVAQTPALPVAKNVAWGLSADEEGGWHKLFGAEETPSTFLVNANGNTVWQYAGKLDQGELAAALTEHLLGGGQLEPQWSHLATTEGARAPDFIFEFMVGHKLGLRKLQGKRVLLNFWKSWSEPCLTELKSLQKLHASSQGNLVVLGINDGQDPQLADQTFKENGFTFHLVTDEHREIASMYGIACWPTTISINEFGLVDGIQFGVTQS